MHEHLGCLLASHFSYVRPTCCHLPADPAVLRIAIAAHPFAPSPCRARRTLDESGDDLSMAMVRRRLQQGEAAVRPVWQAAVGVEPARDQRRHRARVPLGDGLRAGGREYMLCWSTGCHANQCGIRGNLRQPARCGRRCWQAQQHNCRPAGAASSRRPAHQLRWRGAHGILHIRVGAARHQGSARSGVARLGSHDKRSQLPGCEHVWRRAAGQQRRASLAVPCGSRRPDAREQASNAAWCTPSGCPASFCPPAPLSHCLPAHHLLPPGAAGSSRPPRAAQHLPSSQAEP